MEVVRGLGPRRGTGAAAVEPEACRTCVVRHRALCSALTSEEIGALDRISRRRSLPAGSVLHLEGEERPGVGTVLSGVAKLSRGLEDGRAQIVGLLFASDFLGQASGAPRPAPHTVEAATDLELCAFEAEPFAAVVQDHPELLRKLLERTSNELDAARDWMLLLGRKTAPERVASFLHLIAQRSIRSGCVPWAGFDLPLTRADMADFTGLTIETVSRQMTRLRREGVLEMDGPRRVLRADLDELARRAGLR
jgi:CRP/FNR family transcriptional regulator